MNNSNILGISCYYHDSAAALIQDGVLVAAAEEERFSRIKHDFGFPRHAIDFCVKKAGIKAGDLDFVVFYEKPFLKFERILSTALATVPRSARLFRESMIPWLTDKLWIKTKIINHLGISPEKVLFAEHHLSHASSSFFCSPFEEAAILTIDGVGEWTTTAWGKAKSAWNGNGVSSIELKEEMRFPHSLGLLYSAFTAFLGFEVNEGEYKVMGMAPYGKPRYMDKIYKLIDIKSDGSFRLNMDYFCYHYSSDKMFNNRFVDIFGEPREPKSEFLVEIPGIANTYSESEKRRNQYYADIAASIQRVTEDIILTMARNVHAKTGLKKICLAGGVALNSVANGRILRETPFEEIYVQPAAGDSGGALGAALYAYHVLLKKPRRFIMEHAYWGEEYNETQIIRAINEGGLAYKQIADDDKLAEEVAEGMSKGKVTGWFQGRFEWGPRALGNRSILADPRYAGMRDIVNTKIKFREPFRPFAPAVLEEQACDFFAFPDAEKHYPARFMLLVMDVQKEKENKIPAVSHMGTGRLQTVNKTYNKRYRKLIEKFNDITGVPVILNTSFNLKGEPIVTTPENAVSTFLKSGLDVLVMNNFIVKKDK